MAWNYHTDIGYDRTVHVWPDTDLVDHDLDDTCVCIPLVVTYTNGNSMIVHHSLDGRELSE